MQDITKYPHFIPDKPMGLDCFEGHSQEYLAHSICDYMRQMDAKTDGDAKPEEKAYSNMPRIIGVEGSWGSGKSNVVHMIGQELVGDGYYTFTYDAWGHQEDLQRRSILETLTGKLINDNILQGKVKIQMRNGKERTDTWTNQLSLLLSNKTTTIKHSIPLLSSAAVWGICLVAAFAVLSIISGILLDKVTCFPVWAAIVMDIAPIIVGALLAIGFRIKDGNWDRTLKLISQREDDTIDEEYTSNEEPSVAEFKNWMQAVSQYLGDTKKKKYKKLIIVFDNMDRLPSEKVMQLWSSIYTFFAGGEFENIWTIIPYDYKHLCEAIYGDGDKDSENAERIKQFIRKTFPLTYHVPKPVITDYQKLFYTYFEQAFGPDVHDKEHISKVFMHLEDNPNPRTVIRFVNELVAMSLQWREDKYRLQNQALFILKKNFLFHEDDHLETRLLSDELFDKIAPFYPDREKVRTELCQYAFGLKDEDLANEIPLRNELKRRVVAGESIVDYVANPNFLPVLEKVLDDTDQAILDNTVESMASLDAAELTKEAEETIRKKWDYLANMKVESKYDSHEYDEKLTKIIKHATHIRVIKMARAFANAMQQIKVIDGADYYQAQHKLQMALQEAKVKFNDADWYKPTICAPEIFAQYVCEAKEQYKHYGLTANVKALNEYLLNGAISGNGIVATVIDYIKDDKNYDLTDLGKGLSKAINEDRIERDVNVAAYIHRVLDKEEGILKVRFKAETVAAYLNGRPALWAVKLPKGLEDVIAMSLADGEDVEELDDSMLPRICDCMGRYIKYTKVLQNLGEPGSAFRKLNLYCIENQKGEMLDTHYVAYHLQEIQAALGLDISLLLKQFNQWPSIKWGDINKDNEYVNDVKNYVHQSFFRAYLDYPGNFSNSVIELGVATLKLQESGFLVKQGTSQSSYRPAAVLNIDDYWRTFVTTYLGTEFLKDAGKLITDEAITLLRWLYDRNEVRDPDLLDAILERADEATLKTYLHTVMNQHLSKTDITKDQFMYFGRLLPSLSADMDANTARGLIQHFIKPIYKDTDCAAIIVANKDFYVAIMRHDTDIAATIAKEMAGMEDYASVKDVLNDMIPKEEKEKE